MTFHLIVTYPFNVTHNTNYVVIKGVETIYGVNYDVIFQGVQLKCDHCVMLDDVNINVCMS